MPETFLGFPFDEELFHNAWSEAPDPVRTAILNSGAMAQDGVIAQQISGSGNLYTVPFYNILGGDPVNYDGQTDIPATETDGGSQTGVVYGRAKGFTARNFAAELVGNDPMGHIAQSVARYWQKQRQAVMLQILNAAMGVSGASGNAKKWQDNHVVDLSSATATPYVIGDTDLNNLATEALGDNKSLFSLVIMHSNVAKALENKQLLEYWKQTDANGIQRPLNLGSMNGYTVVIDDGVPAVAVGGDGANKGLIKYTTYLLGGGVLRTANARLDHPNDTQYDPAKNGGQETLYTRIRETIHPNGFSFKVPTPGWSESPTNQQLGNSSNWAIQFDPKAIPMAALITNG